MLKCCAVLFLFVLSAIASVEPVGAESQNCSVDAGPISSQQDAEATCPEVCEDYGQWTSSWWTTEPGKASVCQCQSNDLSLKAGPILNQSVAETRCPAVCKRVAGEWTGSWWTPRAEGSICQCSVCEPCGAIDVIVVPISNQPEAEKVCTRTCRNDGGFWTGEWSVTDSGDASICQCDLCSESS